MPIYEFVCKPCSDRFEVLTSPSRMKDTKCPTCGSAKVDRLMSTFATRTSGGSSDSCAGCSSGNCSSCRH